MSSPYPVLNNKSIDQWKVTELKEELKKRKLPVRGLKDELVRRLADAMDAEVVENKKKVDDEVKEDEPKVAENFEVESATMVGKIKHPNEQDDFSSASMVDKVKDPDEQDDFTNTTMAVKDSDITGIVKIGISDDHSDAGKTEHDGATKATSEVTNIDINQDLKMEDAGAVSSGLDASILETEAHVEALEDDATESHTVTLHYDLDAVVTNSEEKLDELMQDDSNLPLEEIKAGPESNNQVSVVSLDLGSQVKCESLPIDSVSIIEKNKLKDNLNAADFYLEQEVVKQEMVQPSSSIVPSLGGDLQTVHDAKEKVNHLVSVEDTNVKKNTFVDEGKKEDNLDEESPEKLNLDRSSSDELMEDDVLESKNIDSNIQSEELVEKIEVIQELVVSDTRNIDVKQDGLILEVTINEDIKKPALLGEKRKLEDQEAAASNEVPKRQRRWSSDTVKIPERQSSNLSTSSAPKNTFEITSRRTFNKPDLKDAGGSQKERIVPPSQKPATTSLRIDRFVRPFTLKAVQELLAKTGTLSSFWMDHIKTHCYVTYSSVEEATSTRSAVYNLQWPPNGGNLLVAEFVDPQEVKAQTEAPPQAPASNPNTPKATNFQQPQAAQPPAHQHALKQYQPLPPITRQPDPQPVRERLPPPPPPPREPDPPALTLDDLFKKTKAAPRIYYLPLTKEEVASKLAARGKNTKN
ncbi:uncharacterized protein LOC121985578 [Zingiber officinale]|uniref:uncharacterized protein LOC121985578 n=1 Tax=Zingiber officinale TaxID=94328 RepID=UPI001C4D8047|nr:uncharacterized protein LOC121985578 [Zingiber officinale]XP_042395058.1 uncharacterized protein LOC121985578 [Zingiber officinale]XP_042395059.1 uncharacterized protein LOC121985578 [Zingiber officinale]XP_042395060.1 uncharacterized protein LOC121985578 [Zingiber officinale]XP_042395061.1 uncharacterized protein LOC121985578 [Zingiber officinale]XP_042395062.1 uncharacterized protein LOC121985578 [Zingiber officinale]XP_042395063.1 uncharacterized protein LOC121985578 [Zingiber officinal